MTYADIYKKRRTNSRRGAEDGAFVQMQVIAACKAALLLDPYLSIAVTGIAFQNSLLYSKVVCFAFTIYP